MSDEESVVEPAPVVEPVETRPLFVVKGDATAEEVAALVAVLHGIGRGSTQAPRPRRSSWAAPHRAARSPLSPGPAGWRSSALPR